MAHSGIAVRCSALGKAIYEAKTKNDKIDAHKMAVLRMAV